MMNKPISKKLLCHSATHYSYVGDGDYNERLFDNPTVLKYVRLDFAERVLKHMEGEELEATHVLFYDMVHSIPHNVHFKENDKVVISPHNEIQELIVMEVKSFYNMNKLHHLEVLLK